MNERARLGILCTLWLLVILFVVFSAANTLQAANNFQQQYSRTKTGDVQAIRPWMTVQVISHVYRVPEDYLCDSIHLTKTDPLRKASLYTVATRKHQSVKQVIHTLQDAILVYRQKHSPTYQTRPSGLHLSSRFLVPEEIQLERFYC